MEEKYSEFVSSIDSISKLLDEEKRIFTMDNEYSREVMDKIYLIRNRINLILKEYDEEINR